ncbi:MAG: CoA transferase, partial [Candidatus Tectomicrobia bacterium]|nr:CoA transferase [Candidatus Tectomicrobia bacterium]
MERKVPLHGIRIVDLTWYLAGPQATRILADCGAEVIKVEHKDRRDQSRLHEPLVGEKRGINSSGYFNNFNRSKLSISLNARHPKGIEILRKLI